MTASASQVADVVYGYGGPALLGRQLDLLLRGRTWLWSGLAGSGGCRSARRRIDNEPDLVGANRASGS